ncbi:hypothetical protein Tco_0615094 [Tanacetum coccineum]
MNEEAIRDSFPDEHLMAIHVREPKADPWKGKIWNLDSTGQLSLKMPHDMFVNARVPKGWECSLSCNQMPLTNILEPMIIQKNIVTLNEYGFLSLDLKQVDFPIAADDIGGLKNVKHVLRDTYTATTDSVVQKRRCIVKQGPCKDLYRLGIDSDIIRYMDNERQPLEQRFNTIIGAWFTLWRD